MSGRCVFCAEIFDPEDISALRCGHTFHPHCLHEWVVKKHKKTCPTCRYPVNGEDEIIKQLYFDHGDDSFVDDDDSPASNLSKMAQRLETDLSNAIKKSKDLEADLKKAQKEAKKLENELDTTMKELEVSKNKISDSIQEKSDLQRQIRTLTKEKTKLQGEYRTDKSTLKRLEADKKKLEKELRHLKDVRDLDDASGDEDSNYSKEYYQKKYENVLREKAALEERIKKLDHGDVTSKKAPKAKTPVNVCDLEKKKEKENGQVKTIRKSPRKRRQVTYNMDESSDSDREDAEVPPAPKKKRSQSKITAHLKKSKKTVHIETIDISD